MGGTDLALGTKVYTRDEQLACLLDSIPEFIETVYIADDGPETELKRELYSRDTEYEKVIIDLPYDAGLGAGRAKIVDALSEEYLLLVDTDHRVPATVPTLVEILEHEDDLGGVGGMIVEPEQDRLYLEGQDFLERRDTIVRSPQLESKCIETIAGQPVVRFDLIPNAAVFRRACVQEYSWDPEYVIEQEHADFFVGHWKNTDWEFGVCPGVLFEHYPGGSQEYESDRHSETKADDSLQYFLDKWGYEDDQARSFVWCEGGNILSDNPSYPELAGRKYTQGGVRNVLKKAWEFFVLP